MKIVFDPAIFGISPLQFMGMQLCVRHDTLDFNFISHTNYGFCHPDEAALTSIIARVLYRFLSFTLS